jgi:hypothetical protein
VKRAPATESSTRGAATGATILVLPITIGRHALAIEATRVVGIRAAAFTDDAGPGMATSHIDLHALLGAERTPSKRDTVIARCDEAVGRTRGHCVAFDVDETKPLLKIPLELIRRLPEILEPNLELDALVAVLDLPEKVRFLVDPSRLVPLAERGGR